MKRPRFSLAPDRFSHASKMAPAIANSAFSEFFCETACMQSVCSIVVSSRCSNENKTATKENQFIVTKSRLGFSLGRDNFRKRDNANNRLILMLTRKSQYFQ